MRTCNLKSELIKFIFNYSFPGTYINKHEFMLDNYRYSKKRNLIPAIVLLLGIISISILIFTNKVHERYHEIFLLDDMSHELQIAVLHSHLILEEIAHGDSSISIETAFRKQGISLKTVDAMLYGGNTFHGKYMQPLTDPELKSSVEEVRTLLLVLQEASKERIESGLESSKDQYYDEVFYGAFNKINRLKNLFESSLIRYENKLNRLFWGILILWSSILIITMFSLASIIDQRRKTEKMLETSEERYRSLAETANDAIISINSKGEIVYWNPGAEHIFGYSFSEIREKPLSIIIPDEFHTAHEEALSRNKHEELRPMGKTVELSGLKRNGTKFPIELSLSSWRSRDGVFFTGIIRDITKRKRIERLLHLSRERYRLIVDDQTELVCRISHGGLLTFVNDAFCRYYKLDRLDLVGQSYLKFIPEHENERVKHLINSLNINNPVGVMELEVITPEDETRWQKWTIKVFIDEKGSIIEYQYVGRDITDRKMVEIELEKYREQLEDLVEKRTFELKKSCEELERESEVRKVAEDQVKNMALFAELNPSPVLRFDIDGRIIMANPAAQDILGDSILLGKKITSVIPGTEDINFKTCIEDGSIFSHAAQIGSRYYHFVFRGAPNLKAGHIYGSDITEQKMAEAESLRTSQLASLGELAAGVAHEVNNPINGIINFAQILSDRAEKGSREYEAANQIINEGDRITSIVSSLLSFARAEKDEMDYVYAEEILNDSLVLTNAQINKNGITIIKEIPSDLLPIYGNYQQIEQVFLNIISNARYALNQKYNGPHKDKILTISAEQAVNDGKSFLKISFQDYGQGIPEDDLSSIMNPFFSSKPRGEGTGLGLSISHGIMRNHGGTIDIESSIGDYTKIILSFPNKEEDESKNTDS